MTIKQYVLDALGKFWTKLKSTYVTNCASTSNNLALAASQGKVLQDQITALNSSLTSVRNKLIDVSIPYVANRTPKDVLKAAYDANLIPVGTPFTGKISHGSIFSVTGCFYMGGDNLLYGSAVITSYNDDNTVYVNKSVWSSNSLVTLNSNSIQQLQMSSTYYASYGSQLAIASGKTVWLHMCFQTVAEVPSNTLVVELPSDIAPSASISNFAVINTTGQARTFYLYTSNNTLRSGTAMSARETVTIDICYTRR